ncbi:MAG: glycosyltransferase family 4 protein [Deltaproteobacteria bacterium]|nr:MAG: glycosyltransferase family 4 protein [Deltaproteobacteria bacterium]
MRIAYVNYGNQSGVTPNVVRSLSVLGHRIVPVDPTGILALRDPRTRLPRPTPRVLLSLAASALRHGPQLIHHRLNTVYAFDQHSRRAGELLEALTEPPDVVLQNGALFAPGRPPRFPYVLLLDNTCLLAERQPPVPEADIGRFIKFGKAWLARERETYQRAMAIATFSALVRQSLIDDYGVDVSVVHVVGAGANIVPKAEPRHDDDGRTLVFVGKDGWRRKGGPVLLRAFAILRRSRPDLRLLIAGPTEAIEVAPGVTNLGLVPLEAVERLLCEATLFVLPTLREPFGIAFLDAMLCKIPCVGTQVGAIPEILGDAGICVPPADAEALAAAISALLDDPARRAAMGEAGRRRVLERGYLWPEVAKRLSAILTSAGHRKRAA